MMMAERKIIAILGEVGSFCPALAEKLAEQHLRLLFVSTKGQKNTEFSEKLRQMKPSAEIEFINCEKEGCWEADIITFTDFSYIEPELVQRIREVATQKVVLAVSEGNEGKESSGKISELRELLPHSHVFQVVLDSGKMEAEITGSTDDAKEVKVIFRNAGYKIR